MDISEKAKQNYNGHLDKDDLVFHLMIRQPEFIDVAYFNKILAFTKKKKANVLLEKVRFEAISDGKCIQMMHLGSFDNEPASFKIMEDYAISQNLIRKSKVHREIYLSDFRKVDEEKLKTVLRFWVED